MGPDADDFELCDFDPRGNAPAPDDSDDGGDPDDDECRIIGCCADCGQCIWNDEDDPLRCEDCRVAEMYPDDFGGSD